MVRDFATRGQQVRWIAFAWVSWEAEQRIRFLVVDALVLETSLFSLAVFGLPARVASHVSALAASSLSGLARTHASVR